MQDNVRKPVREPVREGQVKLRPNEFMGRDGQVLKFTPAESGSEFDFPESVRDPGWSYQWIRTNAFGDTSKNELPEMKRNGWTEVPVTGLKGYFKDSMPEGQNYIEMQGLILVERPAGLTKLHQQYHLDKVNKELAAHSLDRIKDDNWASNLPSGILPWRKAMITDRGEYERAPNAWQPEHKPISMDE